MTKIGKRIIIIAIPVAVSAVLLLSSVFSATKFNTFNCFSSFPAFFGIISGSENATEIDGGKIIMCPPADSVEKLADYHYTERKWEMMLKAKFRLRFDLEPLAEEICQFLDENEEAEKFFNYKNCIADSGDWRTALCDERGGGKAEWLP